MGIKRVKKDEFEYFRKKVNALNKEVNALNKEIIIVQMAFIVMLGTLAIVDLLN